MTAALALAKEILAGLAHLPKSELRATRLKGADEGFSAVCAAPVFDNEGKSSLPFYGSLATCREFEVAEHFARCSPDRIRTLSEAVISLTDQLKHFGELAGKEHASLTAEVERLRAFRTEAMEVLKPFAEFIAGNKTPERLRDFPVCAHEHGEVSINQFLAARRLVEKEEGR